MVKNILSGKAFILTAHFCSLTHFAPFHYCTDFNRYWYEKHLLDNGFIKGIVSKWKFFHFLLQKIDRIAFFRKI